MEESSVLMANVQASDDNEIAENPPLHWADCMCISIMAGVVLVFSAVIIIHWIFNEEINTFTEVLPVFLFLMVSKTLTIPLRVCIDYIERKYKTSPEDVISV